MTKISSNGTLVSIVTRRLISLSLQVHNIMLIMQILYASILNIIEICIFKLRPVLGLVQNHLFKQSRCFITQCSYYAVIQVLITNICIQYQTVSSFRKRQSAGFGSVESRLCHPYLRDILSVICQLLDENGGGALQIPRQMIMAYSRFQGSMCDIFGLVLYFYLK